MMRAELACAAGQVVRQWDALNDVVVAKGTIARMADFAVAIDRQAVADVSRGWGDSVDADGFDGIQPGGGWADCDADGERDGGDADLPAPADHPADCGAGRIGDRVRVTGVPNETFLTVDGQEAVPMHVDDEVRCRRSEYRVRLLRLKPNGLFNVLRSKLKWGER